MKKTILLSTLAILLTAAPAMASEHMNHENHEQKQAEWTNLSKEEKLKIIEERRAEKMKKMDEKWKSMSDDEKIKFVEEKHERKMRKHKDGKGKHH